MISMSLPSKAVRIAERSGKPSTNVSYRRQEAPGTRIRVSPWGGAVARRGGRVVIVLMVVKISCKTGRRARLFSVVGPIKYIDRMDDLDRAAAFLDLAGDLEDAADVAGGDDRGAGGFDVIHLPPAQALRHLGLGQVVRSRCTAAELAFLQWYELEPGDHRQKLPGLAANLLRMAEVASVVIGHFQRHRVFGRDRPERDEELGDVLDLGAEPGGLIVLGGGENVGIFLEHRAAAGRIDDDGVEAVGVEGRHVLPRQGECRSLDAGMIMDGTAAD